MKSCFHRYTGAFLGFGVALAIGAAVSLTWDRDGRHAGLAEDEGANAKVISIATPGDAGTEKPPRGDSAAEARALLAEFALTRDEALLSKVQQLYPGDPGVVLVSCLEAKTPDSPYLALMETLEPENPLPNLMRAGMYAAAKDLERFADELAILVEKGPIYNEVRERRMDMVEVLETKGVAEMTRDQMQRFDTNYILKLAALHSLLVGTPDLYGDDESRTTEVTAKFARMLRQSHEFGILYQMMANHTENTILHRQKPLPENERTSSTWEKHMEQNTAEMVRLSETTRQLQTLVFAESADPVLRHEFFVRLSREGETAAVEWLRKSGNSKVGAKE